MRKNQVLQRLFKALIIISALSFFLASCKKESLKPTPIAALPTRDELTKDSIFLYAKETYFWNDILPAYDIFNPRGFEDNDDELSAIKAMKINPATGKAMDKYSFIDDGTVADELSGIAGDFGFSVSYNTPDDLRISYVYGSSPAALQGVKRGYRITKINGRSDLIATKSANIEFVVNAIYGKDNAVALSIQKPDGSVHDLTVQRGTYNLNPVLFSKVYSVGEKKVGYLVFNSFTDNATSKLDEIFSEFASQDICEVIVDLRYNGGGAASTAEALTNLIAPSSATGKTMYTTYFNKTMQDGHATILKNQKFNAKDEDGVTRSHSFFEFDFKPTEEAGNVAKFAKRGNANISRAYFIVTGSSASSSELVINNLKPVMDVKLIGLRTYGKPVGFFALNIDKLDLYIPMFQAKNSQNYGDYFDGMAVDKEDYDDVTRDFGDPKERYLSYALNFAEKGTFMLSSAKQMSTNATKNPFSIAQANELIKKLNKNKFKGIVNDKLKIKI